jgi:hypothetical protein
VIGVDAVGPDQQEQIRRRVLGLGVGGEFGALPGDALLHLGAHAVRRRGAPLLDEHNLAFTDGHGPAFGMEDDADASTFNVDGSAILAAAAVVGHHRKCVPFALFGRLQVLQRLLHLQ